MPIILREMNSSDECGSYMLDKRLNDSSKYRINTIYITFPFRIYNINNIQLYALVYLELHRISGARPYQLHTLRKCKKSVPINTSMQIIFIAYCSLNIVIFFFQNSTINKHVYLRLLRTPNGNSEIKYLNIPICDLPLIYPPYNELCRGNVIFHLL